MSYAIAKRRPWGHAERRVDLGWNLEPLPWVEQARQSGELTPSEYDVLRVVATFMRHGVWDGSRLCISWIVERVRWSLSTVKRRLASLKAKGFLLRDGQIPVEHGRPVVKYRAGSPPQAPFPLSVWEARDEHEAAGQGGNEPYNLQTAVSGGVKQDPSSYVEREKEISISSADQKETTSNTATSGYVSRVPHVRPGALNPSTRREVLGSARSLAKRARTAAEAVLGSRKAPRLTGAPNASHVAAEGSSRGSRRGTFEARQPFGGAVTYFTPPPEGASMTPFTDPSLGSLPRDARYFYLGLRALADATGQVNDDPRYLKSQVFPYDEDITSEVVADMVEVMVLSGKVSSIPGALVLSDMPPTVIGKEVALFELPPKLNLKPDYQMMDPESAFDLFWKVFPRRQGKGAARKAFVAAVARGADANFIIASATAYGRRAEQIGREKQFIPFPATWLNQERYDDDPEAAPQVRSRADDAFRQNLELVEYYQNKELNSGEASKEIGW